LDLDSTLLKNQPETEVISDEAYHAITGPEFVRVTATTGASGVEFALLADKSKPKGDYRVEELLLELGATPLGVSLGILSLDGKEIDLAVSGDFWRALSRYDLKKDLDYKSNMKAIQLVNDYPNALREHPGLGSKCMSISLWPEYLRPEDENSSIDFLVVKNTHMNNSDGGVSTGRSYASRKSKDPGYSLFGFGAEVPRESVSHYKTGDVLRAMEEIEELKKIVKPELVASLDLLLPLLLGAKTSSLGEST